VYTTGRQGSPTPEGMRSTGSRDGRVYEAHPPIRHIRPSDRNCKNAGLGAQHFTSASSRLHRHTAAADRSIMVGFAPAPRPRPEASTGNRTDPLLCGCNPGCGGILLFGKSVISHRMLQLSMPRNGCLPGDGPLRCSSKGRDGKRRD
jgi:hypothetical protein